MREADVSNSEKLGKMENITVLKSPEEIYNMTAIDK
jgi:flavoprotein